MKDFKSLPQYGNRSKKFVNRYKTNNRVAILRDKQMFALNTATLTFVPNEPCPELNVPSIHSYLKQIYDRTASNPFNRYKVVHEPKPRRNAKCSCGSGLKYKKCCMK